MATFGYETYDSYPVYDPYEEQRRRDEEERRRLEAETPIKQTVTINPDGTKDVTISGSATNLASMSQQSRARAMPIPMAPVAPDETYQRMLNIESGNRDYTAAGTPVTSPAGAMYASQVMPGTAANPGFGIRPAQNQSPEEYNRVGREYFDAMKKKYGGNAELAAAAYHSGPGNVDKALQQAQATGGDWRSYLGPQGQAYVAAAVPENKPVAPAPVAPGAIPQVAQTQANMGEFAGLDQAIADQAKQPQPVVTEAQVQAGLAQNEKERYVNAFLSAQNNPRDMLAFISDPNAPEELRGQMEKSYHDALKTKYRLNEASDRFREVIQSGDTKQLTKVMSTPGEEGSLWRAFLFNLIGFRSGVEAEVAKMNLPGKWQSAVNSEGQTGMIQYSTSNKPLRGIKADGTAMTPEELIAFASQGGAGKVTTSGTFFQTPTGQILRAQNDEQGRTRLVDAGTGARYTGTTAGLVKLEEAGAVRKMDRQLVVDLAKKHGQNVLEAEAEYVKLNGPFKSADERQQFRDAYGFGLATPAPVGGVAGYPGAAAPNAAPSAGPVAPTAPAQPAAAVPGAPAAAPVAPVAPGAVAAPIAQQQQGLAITGEEKKDFIKYVTEDIVPKADAGGQVSRIRKEQIKGPDGILANPEIAGILQGGKGSEVANIIRDLVTGNFKDQTDLSARVEGLGLTDRQKEVLYRQINLATQVNPQTLKANAGAGSVSDAEQKANKAANIDITRQPLYAGLADLGRSQFINDLSVARQEYKNAHPELDTATKFNSAWTAEKSRIQKAYDQVFEARAQYIADQVKKGKQQAGAVVDAFKLLPTPEYNAETKTWDYGTEYARRAARPKLTEFVR